MASFHITVFIAFFRFPSTGQLNSVRQAHMTVSLASKFESLLDSAHAERPLLSWFKRNPVSASGYVPNGSIPCSRLSIRHGLCRRFCGTRAILRWLGYTFYRVGTPQCTFVTKSGSPSRASLALLRLAARDSFTRFGTMNEYGKI